ncbi:TolC family protein [Aurantiacibacter aquimixticola]|uniref:TolC family protein n=1 Tax=Aurantiacibacter aquimixticola TaxID=1958945 RepID=A0A419RWC8_9SPHN|nr:TolC family protein [Aurantiacibacter aquimixticola]RJY10073.1 hypothetical protein D6201_12555 [Aurantiacibacter aquimixticola]
MYGPLVDAASPIALPAPIAIPDPLDRAAVLAAATHPLVDAAEAEAEALGAELRAARWGRYPSASVEALAATEGSSFADEDGIALNAVLKQPLWAGWRITNEIDRARASLMVGLNRVDEAERDIVLRVTSAYHDYVLSAERADALETSLAEHNELLGAIGRRVEREVSPLADLTLGRSRTAQVELDLASAAEARDSALIRLLALTGGGAVNPEMPPRGVSDSLPLEEIALSEAPPAYRRDEPDRRFGSAARSCAFQPLAADPAPAFAERDHRRARRACRALAIRSEAVAAQDDGCR